MSKKLELDEAVLNKARIEVQVPSRSNRYESLLVSKYLEIAQQDKIVRWINIFGNGCTSGLHWNKQDANSGKNLENYLTTRKICYDPATGKIEDITEQDDGE